MKKNAALNIAIDAILHITKETKNDLAQYKVISEWDLALKATEQLDQFEEAIEVLQDLKSDE